MPKAAFLLGGFPIPGCRLPRSRPRLDRLLSFPGCIQRALGPFPFQGRAGALVVCELPLAVGQPSCARSPLRRPGLGHFGGVLLLQVGCRLVQIGRLVVCRGCRDYVT